MCSKTWVINCAIIFSLLLPSVAFAQECKWVQEGGEPVSGLIEVDGVVYYIFEDSKGRQLLKDALDLKSYRVQNEIYEGIVDQQDQMIKSEREMSQMLIEDRKESDRLLAQMIEASSQPVKFYQTSEFSFIAGFISASLTYALWQYTYE